MDHDHLSFVEAVERLAGRGRHRSCATSRPGRRRSAQPGQRQRLHRRARRRGRVLRRAARLAPGPGSAREFLAQRGFDRAAARALRLRLRPRGLGPADQAPAAARASRAQELITAGLAKEARSGSLIDRFRRRLLWPIRDSAGDVIGFGARKLFDDDDGPKYLNTPETPALQEVPRALRHRPGQAGDRQAGPGGHRRGLHRRDGLPPGRRTDRGRDLRHGVRRRPHRRAAPAAAWTPTRYAGEIIFTFDGDAAGQKAALRAFEDDQRFVAQTFIAVSPDNMDPCELRLAKGDVAVRDLVARPASR